jgi:hypothetical protein
MWTLVHLVLAVDVLAARAAGLPGLDVLPWRQVPTLVGLVWLVLGTGVATWSRSLGRPPLPAATVVGVAGATLVVTAEAWTAPEPLVASTVATGLLGIAAAGCWRALRGLAVGALTLAVLSWLVVLAGALDRLTLAADDAAWWRHLSGWPLLALAGYAAVAARLRLPQPVREGAALVALSTLCLLVAGPSTTLTADRLTAIALALGLAPVAAAARPTWARPAALLAGLGALGLAVDLLVRSFAAVSSVPGWDRWSLADPLPTGEPHAWTAAVAAAVLPVAAAALLTLLPADRRAAARVGLLAAAPVLLAIGTSVAVLESGPALLTAAALTGGSVAVGAVAAILVRRRPAAVAAAATLTLWPVVLVLRVTAASHLLAALTASALALLAGAVLALAPAELLGRTARPAAGATATLLAGAAVVRWAALAGASGATEALVLAVLGAVAGAVAGRLRRGAAARSSVELAAVLVGAVAVVVATGVEDGTAASRALVLTVLGAGVCLVAVLEHDRAVVSWAGAALLGLATVLRAADGLPAPERWTLPVAVLLLAAGARRLCLDPWARSTRALGSGLTLALLPSLLLALEDPVSARAGMVGVGGLLALVAGVRGRWAAPLAAGAVVTGALAVRHLGPVAEALPRWISLGLVGVVLLAVGVTWESRRRNLAAAGHYVAALR